MKIKLYDISYARSGDKGGNANIGVIANDERAYDLLVNHLTALQVQKYFSSLCVKEVKRYLLPNLQALNFVLYGILSDGESASLRIDNQGKALGQALLEMEIEI